MKWIKVEDKLPKERKDVLLRIKVGKENFAFAVGYIRVWSEGPYFVVPGFGPGDGVTHWCDCLPGEFLEDARRMYHESEGD